MDNEDCNNDQNESAKLNDSSTTTTTNTTTTPATTEETEKTNLIVNYLPQQMTDEEFENLFNKFGPMKSCKVVRNKATGYSYGFGFVDFETHEQSLRAIEELNGNEVDTKKIKVAFARPANQDIKQANLYVKGVPSSWSQDDVKRVFEPYGQIIQVRVLGNDRNVAFVLFDLRKQAEEAIEALNGKTVEGCDGPLEIKFAADKKAEKRGNNRQNQSRRGGQDRGARRDGGGRSMSNNRDNRNNSDQRRGTSQPSRGSGGRGMFNKNSNNNNSNGNSYNDQMNGGIGPMRQQSGNRMNRYAPFAPMQQPPMQPTAAPGMVPNPYGYAPQPMIQYMMPNQMMPMAGPPMNPYAQMGYAQPPAIAQPNAAMSNMYNMASSTMNNAAQMQPQLGQPMNVRGGVQSGVGGGTGSVSGGGSQQGGISSNNNNNNNNNNSDGVTLFVYNIGPTSDENELKTIFAPYGDVLRCNVVRKTPGGETKGFGFVTVRSRDQASAAIAALNGQMRNDAIDHQARQVKEIVALTRVATTFAQIISHMQDHTTRVKLL